MNNKELEKIIILGKKIKLFEFLEENKISVAKANSSIISFDIKSPFVVFYYFLYFISFGMVLYFKPESDLFLFLFLFFVPFLFTIILNIVSNIYYRKVIKKSNLKIRENLKFVGEDINLNIEVKDIGKRIKEQRAEINHLLQKYSIKEIEVFKDKYKKLDYVFYQAIIDRKNISNDFLDEIKDYINDNSVDKEDLKRAYESLKNKETITEEIIND